MKSNQSVQLLSCVWFFTTPWTAAHQASLSITNSWSLLRIMSIKLVMPSSHPTLCCPLLLLPPSIFPNIRVFSNESVLHIRWPKNWSFGTSSSNEYLGLISFRMDWLDLLAVQGTLKSLLQHHSSKASIPRHSAFFVVQLSDPYNSLTYLNTGKAIALLCNMLSRLVITFFFSRSELLFISWLQSLSAVILEPQKIKSATVSTIPHLFPMKWWDQMPWSSFSECWALSEFFHSPISLSSRGSLVLLHFLP